MKGMEIRLVLATAGNCHTSQKIRGKKPLNNVIKVFFCVCDFSAESVLRLFVVRLFEE